MKLFASILFISTFLYSCEIRNTKKNGTSEASDQQVITDSTTVQILDSIYNFGKVTDGDKVEFSFRFKNTGKKPLIITAANASCGCTVAEKPEAPIAPGETSFIKAVFNTAGRIGDAHKEIYVKSNAVPAFPQLKISGMVEAKK
ncbi:hypothetical protein BH09BAC2_BH09BAC2_11150 [soil metagenome]